MRTLPLVVLPSSVTSEPRVRVEEVDRIISNRRNTGGDEQYLVQWLSDSHRKRPPFSWHTLNELSPCLELIQDYIDSKPRPSKKRKAPDSDDTERHPSHTERQLEINSRSSSVEVNVYNGYLEVKEGFISAKSASAPDIPQLRMEDVPARFLAAAQRSGTTEAESRIRAEIIRRLRLLPGPRVRIVNTYDSSSPSLRFRFIMESVLREGVYKADPATQLGCTRCSPAMGRNIGCEYTKKCDCLEYAAVDVARLTEEQKQIYDIIQAAGEGNTSGFPKRFPYFTSGTKIGCLVPFYLDSRNAIYECNDRCRCGPDCRNKNVQFGCKVELEIFKTVNRGWGLRSKQDLRQGEFIDTYRGEIITDEEATKREERAGNKSKNSYLYSLDKFAESEGLAEEEIYVIDGEFMGGPTKFINHSCEPNCRQYTVSYNKHDCRVYDIAFFAIRDIRAGEELTFDYLDKEEDEEDEERAKEVDKGAVPCHCGSRRCRKWLWK